MVQTNAPGFDGKLSAIVTDQVMEASDAGKMSQGRYQSQSFSQLPTVKLELAEGLTTAGPDYTELIPTTISGQPLPFGVDVAPVLPNSGVRAAYTKDHSLAAGDTHYYNLVGRCDDQLTLAIWIALADKFELERSISTGTERLTPWIWTCWAATGNSQTVIKSQTRRAACVLVFLLF